MQTMYPAMVNSPATQLAQAIDATQTTIELVDGSKLPAAPNLATIGTAEDAETILYTAKNGNTLSGVTRGFQGAAKAWPAGTQVGRYITAYDLDALRQNVEENAGALAAHLADFAQYQQNAPQQIRTDPNIALRTEVVSSSASVTPDAGRIIFDTSQGKFFGGNGAEWV